MPQSNTLTDEIIVSPCHHTAASTHSLVLTVKDRARSRFQNAKSSHDWDHTLRVAELCKHIGSVETADMVVLLMAAYLHDIGRCVQDQSNGRLCHAEKGADMAFPLIEDLDLSDSRKANVIHSIKTHRFRGRHIPETLEARVLFDADKLDAIGAIGIARAYLFAGEVGARLHNLDHNIENTKSYSMDDTGYREFKVKLSKIKDRMLTVTGRKLAIDRHVFMETFYNRLIEEHDGKR